MCIRSIQSRPVKVSMRSCYIFVSPKRENRSHLQMDHLIEKSHGCGGIQIEHFPFSQKEQAHNPHVALLEHHETKQDPHLGIAEGQTKSQCTVCQFVRDRVKRLAQICDHVELSCDHPIKQIRTLLLPDRGNRIPE